MKQQRAAFTFPRRPLPALAASTSTTLAQQIVLAVNQDRGMAGLSALTMDSRLTAVAEARAAYLITTGVFSHCSGGEADTSCPLSGYDFVAREAAERHANALRSRHALPGRKDA
ncbi:MAG TPA: CAP domain-containing protein [Chloroflexota bacterium]